MSPETRQKAIIIGAGPAGLTAAWELADRTDVRPIVLEATGDIGGLSRTAVFRGNRIDIGGHRFFSKSSAVMTWWKNVLPLQGAPARDDAALNRLVPLVTTAARRAPGTTEAAMAPAPDPEKRDDVMLVRQRLSRILFERKFFDYPLTLNATTLRNLGPLRLARMASSYVAAALHPIRPERSLEDFFVNRFGRELYSTFFRDYTEKVWGVPCREIGPDWGAQRVKGLSIAKALSHAARRPFRAASSISQKDTETSLIERFLYPKHGPGQLWEEVARQVAGSGGEVHLHHRVVAIRRQGDRIASVTTEDASGTRKVWSGKWVISSMPIRELVSAIDGEVPEHVSRIAAGLQYRDFVTVGLLLRRLAVRNETSIPTLGGLIPDNWIYVQEPDVRLGRIQVFNNWSPYLVEDPGTVWLGLEYFCQDGDAFWATRDEDLVSLAARELERIGIAACADVLDGVVLRVPKAYPAYFGTFSRLGEIRSFTDSLENLFLIGRNGMHRYNNMDHSMLTATAAVDAIRSGERSRDGIWAVNAEESYHEERA